jgi:hypothetical protein
MALINLAYGEQTGTKSISLQRKKAFKVVPQQKAEQPSGNREEIEGYIDQP